MGPRIFIRGNGRARAGRGRCRPRFNGAADLHPRKLEQRHESRGLLHASMGPRIFIRGNTCIPRRYDPRLWLQWGRGSSSAETSFVSLAPGTSLASMGPRIFIRGNAAEHGDHVAAEHASMGPRIFIRGNDVQARIEQRPGIASMGPRIFIRGNALGRAASRPHERLQWGRGSSSAETSRTNL